MPVRHQRSSISKFGFLVISVFVYISGLSQNPLISSYTDLDGLPSTTLYDMLQDETGYLWIATENGISVFDGNSFRNYGLVEGLNDMSIVHLYQDRYGRIWGMGYNGTLSCIDDRKIINTDKINDLITKSIVSYVDDMYIDSSDRIWIAPRYGGLLRIDDDSTIVNLMQGRTPGASYILQFSDLAGDIFISAVRDTLSVSTRISGTNVRDNNISMLLEGITTVLHRNAINIGPNEYLVSYKRQLIHIKNGETISEKSFNYRIIDLMKDYSGNIWISVFSEGVYKFKQGNLDSTPENFFIGEVVSKVIQDNEGGYWISTTDNGLFYIKGLDFNMVRNNIGEEDYKVLSITSTDNYLYYTTSDHKIYRINPNKHAFDSEVFEVEDILDHLFSISSDRRNRLWVSGTSRRAYTENGEPVYNFEIPAGLMFKELRDGRIVLNSFNDLTILKDGKITEIPDTSLTKRIFNILEDEKGVIWIGTLAGIYQYENGYFEPYVKFPEINEKRITAFEKLQGYYIAGTANNGLWSFNEDSIFIIQNNFPAGIGKINCFFNEGDSVLWIGTNSGLVRLHFEEEKLPLPDQTRFQRAEGLPSNQVNDLAIFDDKLWIGTDAGLVCFENRHAKQIENPPEIIVSGIMINERPIPLSSSLLLKPKENNIRFNFTGISLKGKENVNYRFMLGGHDNEILYTKDEFVNYSNLQSGEYYFFVNAGNSNGIWNSDPNTTYIKINKAFTETFWFYLVLFLAALAIASIIFGIANTIQKRRNKLKEEILVMQQRLLRSQMNPHFVFNSLLSIQNFIYKNEPSIAGKYLSRFAKLIRLILNSSRKDYITLDDEIQFLNHYLDLQKLRFNERFDYRFEIDKKIKPEVFQIPPMLAQPFIENSIEHGLKNISHKGLIIIRFFLENNTLVFEIEDNGVGIYHTKRKEEVSSPKHESLGQQITTDRLRLLDQSRGKKVSFKIEELSDDNDEVKGTKVSFRIAL